MLRRILTVLVTALALLGVAVAPASARDLAVSDAVGDMWRQTDGVGEATRAPGTRQGDVRRAVFVHNRTNIVVTQRYAALRRVGRYANYSVRLQNAARGYREVVVETSRRSWAGKVRVFARNGNRVACAATHRVDYGADTVTVRMPRSCLGTPHRIRATATSSWADAAGDFFMDNPHNGQSRVDGWTRRLAAG
jgi:hypothetical protein